MNSVMRLRNDSMIDSMRQESGIHSMNLDSGVYSSNLQTLVGGKKLIKNGSFEQLGNEDSREKIEIKKFVNNY